MSYYTPDSTTSLAKRSQGEDKFIRESLLSILLLHTAELIESFSMTSVTCVLKSNIKHVRIDLPNPITTSNYVNNDEQQPSSSSQRCLLLVDCCRPKR